MIVKLCDVVDKISGNEDRFTTKLKYYLAGEHYESERIAIYKKGIIRDDINILGFKFHFPFRSGDTIFMSRNPHLKKAGKVTYDGICSDTSYILRTKDEAILLEDFLPLILQNDQFWRWFEENKSGSVNYLLNWKTLKEYEFDLPTIEKQRKISDLAWAIEEARVSYENLISATEELVKSRFVEMFGDLYHNPMNWPVKNFTELATIESNMIHDFTGYEDFPHIGIDSIEKNTGALVGYRTVREDGIVSGKYLFTPKHIIYSKIRPNLNKVALPTFEGVCSADSYAILPNESVCNRIFLAHVMRSQVFLDYILPFSNRTNMPKVNRKQVEGFNLPTPPIALQNQFADFVALADKSKSVLQKTLEKLAAVKAAIMREWLT